mmetsp:Transcript_23662/g.38679  ORF Transcript_23662/g.38679 Transcript_23662/m.38679 type:complete len:107 (-) Transcript_23662:341-661(-)
MPDRCVILLIKNDFPTPPPPRSLQYDKFACATPMPPFDIQHQMAVQTPLHFLYVSPLHATPRFSHLSPVLLFAIVEFVEGQWMTLISRFMGNVCCYSSPPRVAKSE